MRKMDEMELYINLKAIKWSWLYTVLFLFAWTVYDYFKQGTFNFPAFFLLVTQNIIYLIIRRFLILEISKDEK